DHAVARLGIDDPAHVLERDREVSRDARYHRVGVAERHHAGGEVVAVGVDQPMAVALQEAFALEPLVQVVRVRCIALRERRVDDLDAATQLDAERSGSLAYAVLAADEEGAAQPLLHEARGGADHLLLLALGEDYALWPPPQPFVDALQHACDRIAASA